MATRKSVMVAGIKRESAHRWKVLGVGVAANASITAAVQGIPTTAVWLLSDYHLSTAELGLAFGSIGLGLALSELPWGMLTDRWGDRPVLLTGLLSAAAMLVAMAWFRDDERGLAMSIRQTAIPLGGGLGALILPRLAASHGFATVYAVLAAMCAVSAAFTWRWLHEPPFAGAAASGVPSTSQTEPLRDAQIWRVVWGIGILCAPMFAVVTFATVFLHDLAHLGIGAISGTMVVLQLGAMVMRVWSGLSTDRRGNRRAYLRGSTLCFRSRCGSKPECMNLIWPARDRLVSLNMTVDLAEASFEIPFIDLGAAYRTFLIEGV